jgi:5-methyltetrahydrofolate--homocysteine methyltransferase
VVHVGDAGQSAAVVRTILSETERPRFLEELEIRSREAAERHGQIAAKTELLSLESARKNRLPQSAAQGPNADPVAPKIKGLIDLSDYSLERVIPFIDWDGFLRIWSLDRVGNFSTEKDIAKEKLLEDARKILDRVLTEKLLCFRGVAGIFPTCSDGDDVLVYGPEGEPRRFALLRNQEKKRAGAANPCLADFLPGRNRDAPGGVDAGGWLGLFALSASFGLEEAAAAFRSRSGDYNALLLGTLADSLAEAFAEEVHLRIRREWWGYGAGESLSVEDVLLGKYTGIRPAFGYPPCPDHQDKRICFDILEAQKHCDLI